MCVCVQVLFGGQHVQERIERNEHLVLICNVDELNFNISFFDDGSRWSLHESWD